MEAGSNRFYDYKSQIENIENNFSIVSNEMGKNIPFKLFPHQYDFLKTLGEKNNVISANSRQCGITTLLAASMKWYQDPRYNRGLPWHKKNSANGDDMVDADKIIDEQKNIKYDKEIWEGLIKDRWKPTSAWYENMKMFFNNDAKKIAQELDASFQ